MMKRMMKMVTMRKGGGVTFFIERERWRERDLISG